VGAPASIPTPISGGGGSANPLTRIQNEDGGYVAFYWITASPELITCTAILFFSVYGILAVEVRWLSFLSGLHCADITL
jgi:hypothetical protein